MFSRFLFNFDKSISMIDFNYFCCFFCFRFTVIPFAQSLLLAFSSGIVAHMASWILWDARIETELSMCRKRNHHQNKFSVSQVMFFIKS